MKRIIIYLLLLINALGVSAQSCIKGKVVDKVTEEPLGFVNVRIYHSGSTEFASGAVTDVDGLFSVQNLSNGKYTLSITFVGYKEYKKDFEITDKNQNIHFPFILLTEDTKTLKEVQVTGQKSAMKLEVDRKSFDVSQMISNAGEAASDVLQNIPSVEVDNDGNVSLRGNESVEVWINGKASGLTADNRAQILQQLPAESIDRIEVIDNPSAKFSAEGSAGIINIILKKDRKAGYYGSIQAGANTRKGANTSFNINYNSKWLDAYANIGYRHRSNTGHTESDQTYTKTNEYQRYNADNDRMGNNLFSRAGLTFHATTKDDFSVSGMLMTGRENNNSLTPYHYGTVGALTDTYQMMRKTYSGGDMNMYYGEFNYRHSFNDKHFIDFVINTNKWNMDNDNIYQDSTSYSDGTETEYDYMYRPLHINNRSWETKLDYENAITDKFKVMAGYQGNFSKENTPQESFKDNSNWNGTEQTEDKDYFNRFIYKMDLHALYTTLQYQLGKVGIMAGLRGEYWKVNTESYTWEQEHDATKRDKAFKKDYFQLFPSVFMSYQITKNDQLQLNYTRRLRRPWGGELNSYKNTSDASIISYGNPELTPEYSNSFALNYLKTWTEHSLLISTYYRPTSDVMQRINYQSSKDGNMYQTNFNVAKSLNTGIEATLKDKFFKILDLTTNVNVYYYKLNGFSYDIDGQDVTGEGNEKFTWNARVMASIILPYSISIQTSGRYTSRQSVAQGYRKANFMMDFGIRKNFFNKLFTLSINCKDLLNSRKFETYTSSEDFTRYQLNKRGGRKVNFTLTWNFGNSNSKKKPQQGQQKNQDDNNYENNNYSGGGED